MKSKRLADGQKTLLDGCSHRCHRQIGSAMMPCSLDCRSFGGQVFKWTIVNHRFWSEEQSCRSLHKCSWEQLARSLLILAACRMMSFLQSFCQQFNVSSLPSIKKGFHVAWLPYEKRLARAFDEWWFYATVSLSLSLLVFHAFNAFRSSHGLGWHARRLAIWTHNHPKRPFAATIFCRGCSLCQAACYLECDPKCFAGWPGFRISTVCAISAWYLQWGGVHHSISALSFKAEGETHVASSRFTTVAAGLQQLVSFFGWAQLQHWCLWACRVLGQGGGQPPASDGRSFGTFVKPRSFTFEHTPRGDSEASI